MRISSAPAFRRSRPRSGSGDVDDVNRPARARRQRPCNVRTAGSIQSSLENRRVGSNCSVRPHCRSCDGRYGTGKGLAWLRARNVALGDRIPLELLAPISGTPSRTRFGTHKSSAFSASRCGAIASFCIDTSRTPLPAKDRGSMAVVGVGPALQSYGRRRSRRQRWSGLQTRSGNVFRRISSIAISSCRTISHPASRRQPFR